MAENVCINRRDRVLLIELHRETRHLITLAVMALTAALVAPRCSVTHRNGRAWLVFTPRNRAYLYEDWYRVPLWSNGR